ncbi:MAG: hypothetical protein ACHQQQ_01575 [Bacteroidota bacterium]
MRTSEYHRINFGKDDDSSRMNGNRMETGGKLLQTIDRFDNYSYVNPFKEFINSSSLL